MNAFALSGLLIGVSSISMTVLMLMIGKEKLHYIWALFCAAVAIWGFGVYGVATTQSIQTADFLWRLTHIGVVFIPILFTHFVYQFLGKPNKVLLWTMYAFGLFFLVFNFAGGFLIANMRWVFNQFYYDSPPGPLYPLLTIWLIGLVGYSHYLLWQAYRNSATQVKIQISYFFIATAIGFAGGLTSFLPVYGIDMYPFGNFTVFLYPLIITYAIIKKHLFGARTVLTQLFVGFIAVLLLANIFSSQTVFERLWKTVLFFAFMGAGYLLVKSVLNEIKQREELEYAYAKLKEVDRAKTEFVSIASHQLRTPLTAIKGYISMILEGTYGKLTQKEQRPMQNVFQSNERLIKLVNDLLSISRIESGKIEMKWAQTNLKELIESVLEELQIKAQEKKLSLMLQKPQGETRLVRIDSEKIRNALLNIVDNAIRYTNKGVVTVGLHITNDKALITVTDTGEGMSQEEMSKLFESFSRGGAGTRLWTEGAGLGLYIAKQFVQLHKGKIWAASEGKGKGSTFFIELPVY